MLFVLMLFKHLVAVFKVRLSVFEKGRIIPNLNHFIYESTNVMDHFIILY